MEDAANEACMIYRAQRFEKMKEDQFRFLPRCDLEKEGWGMMEPQGLDTTTKVMVHFAREILQKNDVLKEELEKEKEKKARKWVVRQLDEYRTQLKMPKIYEKLPRVHHHKSLESLM